MFDTATNFNQNLCDWNISQVTYIWRMFDGSKCPHWNLVDTLKCQHCV